MQTFFFSELRDINLEKKSELLDINNCEKSQLTLILFHFLVHCRSKQTKTNMRSRVQIYKLFNLYLVIPI